MRRITAKSLLLAGVLIQGVHTVNAKLSNIEKIRRFVIAKEAFTIKNKLMTPTMKVRRHMVVKHYGEKLEQLYNKPTKGDKRGKKEG